MDIENMYKAYYMQVYSYVITLCRDKHMAEDITQDTFYKAMHADGKSAFQEKSKELTWLCAIAKNLFTDEMRRRKRFTEMPPDIESGEDIASEIEDEDLSFKIHMVLHSLEEPYKEVFQLRTFGELPFEKIGILFGKTENWARVTYHRARLKIKERMDSNE